MIPLPWVFVFINIFLCLYIISLYTSLYAFVGFSGLKVFKHSYGNLPW